MIARTMIRTELVWDPGTLTPAQRSGDECVSCEKRWPRPRAHVGVLQDGRPVYACTDCAQLARPNHEEPTTREKAVLRGMYIDLLEMDYVVRLDGRIEFRDRAARRICMEAVPVLASELGALALRLKDVQALALARAHYQVSPLRIWNRAARRRCLQAVPELVDAMKRLRRIEAVAEESEEMEIHDVGCRCGCAWET